MNIQTIKKTAFKIFLDGNFIATKPFLKNDNLHFVREKIKSKIKHAFQFLDQDGKSTVDVGDEDDLLLEDIINDNIINIIKSTNSGINIFFKDKNICVVDCSEECKLNEVRNLIKNQIHDDFIFLDQGENNVEIDDEKDMDAKSIMINDSMKIQISNSSNDSPPANLSLDSSNKSNKQKYENNILKKNEEDFYEFEIIEQLHNNTDHPLSLLKYPCFQSNTKGQSVFEYFYDSFDPGDLENAYLVLFCGKTGDGKTTAINAFFYFIKGIKNEDNKRFI